MRRTIPSLCFALALATPVAADDAAWSPSVDDEAVYQALSIRDPVPSCEQVEALVPQPVAALRNVVAHAQLPPWAPMRAAHCLISRHGSEVESDLLAWVGQEETLGLGLLVLDEVELLDEELGLRVAKAALTGPLAAKAQERLAGCGSAALRALVQPAEATEP